MNLWTTMRRLCITIQQEPNISKEPNLSMELCGFTFLGLKICNISMDMLGSCGPQVHFGPQEPNISMEMLRFWRCSVLVDFFCFD